MKKLVIIFLMVVSVFGFERKSMFGMTLLSSRPIEEISWYSAAGMTLSLHTIGGTRLGLYVGYQGLPKYESQDINSIVADANDILLSLDTIPGGYRVIRGGLIIALGEHLSIWGGANLVFDCFVVHKDMLENYNKAEYYLEESISDIRLSWGVGGRFFEYVNTEETWGVGFIGGYSNGIKDFTVGIELAWELGK